MEVALVPTLCVGTGPLDAPRLCWGIIVWKVVEGNLLDAQVEALVNAVNTAGVMGKGIALQFKEAFPEMFEEYAKLCKSGELQPGKLHVHDRGQKFSPRYIINFPTKRHWRGKSRASDIQAGLMALVEELAQRRIRSVAVPALGCGYGGLSWQQVFPLIQRAFDKLPEVQAYIYAPQETAGA